MNLQEVVKKAHEERLFFKRPCHKNYFWTHTIFIWEQLTPDIFSDKYVKAEFSIDDCLANDWETLPAPAAAKIVEVDWNKWERINSWGIARRFFFYMFHKCGPYIDSENGHEKICKSCGYKYITRKYIEETSGAQST